MKNIFKTLLSLSIVTGVLFSCENEKVKIKEENSFSQTLSLEELQEDIRMEEYLSSNTELLHGITDINRVQKLSSKENLSTIELEQLSISLGFDSFKSYNIYYKNQTTLLKNLEKDYGLTNYTATEINNVLFYENLNYASRGGGACEGSCWRSFKNCMGLTTTAALTAHAGCIALDPTIIAGIACHGIALAAQYFAQDECSNQASKCFRKCSDTRHDN